MFTQFSMTYTGGIVLAITWLVKISGVEIGDEQITAFVLTAAQLVGVVQVLYGRFRKGDINIFGKKS